VHPAPLLPVSPWIARPTDAAPPLDRDLRVDAAVVGGGITGLSAALALAERGARVALLERDFCGAGASGRNAGHLTPTIGKDLPTLLRVFGRERAQALVRFADEAVAHTERTLVRLGSDCEYRATGNVMAAVHPGQEPRLRRAAAAGAALGAKVHFAGADEMRERGLPRAFPCGVFEERGGTLHPGRYVRGLRDAARRAGVQLFETTQVTALEPGRPVQLRAPGGTVTADSVLLATNAYTPELGLLRRAALPLRVSLFETEPLSAEARRAVGWPGDEGLYTAHESLESYRTTPRGTLVGGAKVVHYAFGSRRAPAEQPRAFRRLERAFRDRFPELADTAVAHTWGGWIAFPLDSLPATGDLAEGVAYALGYAGHGLAQAGYLGALAAERTPGHWPEAAAALRRRSLRLPPEPLRWLLFHGIVAALRVVDARTDRRARAWRARVAPDAAGSAQGGPHSSGKGVR